MSIWDKYPNYDSHEFRTVVRVTTDVLLDSAGETDLIPPDVLELSTRTASKEIVSELGPLDPAAQERLQALIEQPDTAETLGLAVLAEVRTRPGLAERVAAAYEKESRKLGGLETLLVVGPLLILAIKIRSIEVDSKKSADGSERRVKIEWWQAGEAVKSAVTGLLSKVGIG